MLVSPALRLVTWGAEESSLLVSQTFTAVNGEVVCVGEGGRAVGPVVGVDGGTIVDSVDVGVGVADTAGVSVGVIGVGVAVVGVGEEVKLSAISFLPVLIVTSELMLKVFLVSSSVSVACTRIVY